MGSPFATVRPVRTTFSTSVFCPNHLAHRTCPFIARSTNCAYGGNSEILDSKTSLPKLGTTAVAGRETFTR